LGFSKKKRLEMILNVDYVKIITPFFVAENRYIGNWG